MLKPQLVTKLSFMLDSINKEKIIMAISLGGFSGGGGGAGSDTLDDVTGRGATTTNAITVGGVSIGSAFSLPTSDGSANQVLQTNGSGSLSFATLDFTGGLEYKGSFNATAGTPSLATAQKGDYYKIDTAGTIYGQTWAVNDSLIINADMGGSITNSKIDKIDNTEPTNVLITTNNLSDLDNATTARTNLGLGNAATLTTGVANGNVIVADSTGLPAIDGSQLTGITATDSTKLAIANNLSDLDNATTARTNLGLGNVATLTTGVANGNVIVADSTGLPAIDGSQLTGVTATDSTKLAIANNLSDLNNAGTARTNLGLGTASTSASSDFLSATGADSLGGNIDVNGHDIISSSNGDIEIAPDGNGSFIIKGNATSGSGRIVLNCEQNSHGITLKGPPHSAGASYTLTLPNDDGDAGEVLKTDGNGNLDWVAQSGGNLPTVTSASTTTTYPSSGDLASSGLEQIYLLTPTNNTTVNLAPAASCGSGFKYQIKNLGSHTITLDPNGSEYIDHSSQTTFAISDQYTSITLVSDGSNWFII